MRTLVIGGISALALALALAGCGSDGKPRSQPPPPTAPVVTAVPTTPPTTAYDAGVSWVARATVPSVAVYDQPGLPEPAQTLDNPRPSAELGATSPLVLLVREQQGEWLNVLLPVRPNGSTGWVRQSDVSLESHNFRIVIELSAFRISAWRGKELLLQEPVGVGRSATGTPDGLFYTTELLEPVGQPAYGPYAFALSGYSEVLSSFAGGPGVLGIHGTNDPSGLGTNVSNGCVRMSNEAITRLAESLPIGVPVEIRG